MAYSQTEGTYSQIEWSKLFMVKILISCFVFLGANKKAFFLCKHSICCYACIATNSNRWLDQWCQNFYIKHTSNNISIQFLPWFQLTVNALTMATTDCSPQPYHLSLLHNLGAAISFICTCFYTVLLTALTGKCVLTGYEKVLYPLRIVSTVIQVIVTICCILSERLGLKQPCFSW